MQVHFLDSPEQGSPFCNSGIGFRPHVWLTATIHYLALLVIPIFADIGGRGGGTYISPDAISMMARYLASHPEGVLPTGLSFTPQGSSERFEFLEEVKQCNQFVELTGKVSL